MKNKSFVPALLLGIYIVEFIVLAFNPYDRADWWAENLPIMGVVVALTILWYRGVRLSNTSYLLMSVLIFWHTIGGHYTFERVPFGFITDLFNFKRNMFDRIGHFSVGFYAFAIAEYMDKRMLTKSKLLNFFFPIFTIAFVAVAYEWIEWWFAVGYGGDSAGNFLGSQGDIWDAQKDMLMDTLGGVLATVAYFVFRKKK